MTTSTHQLACCGCNEHIVTNVIIDCWTWWDNYKPLYWRVQQRHLWKCPHKRQDARSLMSKGMPIHMRLLHSEIQTFFWYSSVSTLDELDFAYLIHFHNCETSICYILTYQIGDPSETHSTSAQAWTKYYHELLASGQQHLAYSIWMAVDRDTCWWF